MSTVSVDRSQPKQYEFNGARYYSVSQVVQVLTGETYAYGSAEAMQRGTDIHAWFAWAVNAYAGNDAEQPDLSADHQPYMQGIYDWIAVAKPLPMMTEERAVSTVLGVPFAGTPDLLASILHGGKRKVAVIDLKTGQPNDGHRIQVQAYSRLDGYTGAEVLMLLYVSKDGFKTVTVKKSPRDWAAFQSALSVLAWRESH